MQGSTTGAILRIPPPLSALTSLWRALVSIRLAIVTIGALAAACCAGILLPQLPPAASIDNATKAGWIEQQEASFGPITPILNYGGFFDVFHSWWFLALLAWLAASLAACTARRLPAALKESFAPPPKVAEKLYVGPGVAILSEATSCETVERAFRHRHFRVRREERDGATHLFADRFAWSGLGTIAIHFGVLLVLVGALISSLSGFNAPLAIAEGTSAPVFGAGDGRHLIVTVERAIGTFDHQGRPLDFRSELTLTSRGSVLGACTVTVNSPCDQDGYRLHQSGFFRDGALLRVRDTSSGKTLYLESVPLVGSVVAPHVIVRDVENDVLFDGTLPQSTAVAGVAGAFLALGDAANAFWVELSSGSSPVMSVLDASASGNGASVRISEGARGELSGLTFEFRELLSNPAATLQGVPRTQESRTIVATLERPIPGSVTASQQSLLQLSGLSAAPVSLKLNEPVQIGSFEYEFLGERAFAGITVRRDRGDTLIWIGGALFVIGLATALWFPRRQASVWIPREGRPRLRSSGRTRVELPELQGETTALGVQPVARH